MWEKFRVNKYRPCSCLEVYNIQLMWQSYVLQPPLTLRFFKYVLCPVYLEETRPKKVSSWGQQSTAQHTANRTDGAPPSTRAPLVFHKVNDTGI
jgi:hypothetical protein